MELELLIGVGLAFLAQISQIGKGLQKEAAAGMPPLSGKTVGQYFTNAAWLRGISLDCTGAIIGLVALGMLPISIAQPIFCNGLVLLALFAHFYLKERLAGLEWAAVALCFVGTLLLAFTLSPTNWDVFARTELQVKLVLMLVAVLVVIGLLEVAVGAAKTRGDFSTLELCSGAQAGISIGAGNSAISAGLKIISLPSLAPLLVAGGIGLTVAGIVFSAAQAVFANRGYSGGGRALLIWAYTTLVALMAGVASGIFVLEESWPQDRLKSNLRAASLILSFGGVLLLNWRTITGGADKATVDQREMVQRNVAVKDRRAMH